MLDQGEPQFASTLGRKTHHDHEHVQLQLERVLLILAGDMCGRGSCGGLPASCWMSVMARPWVWPPCSRPRLRDLCWQVSNVVGCKRCFCKTGLRVDEFTKSYMWESHWGRSMKVGRTGRDGPQTGRLRRMGEWRGHSRIVSLEHGSPRR